MVARLPDELLDSIQQQIVFRQAQLEQLSLFYNSNFPSPRALVTYGSEDTDQLHTIEHVLKSQEIQHVIINCSECLSQRHLLSKIFARCVKQLGQEDGIDRYDRLDSINALGSNLKKLLQARTTRLVLVLLNADRQRGATSTLFPALARLGDIIPCLSLILTSNAPRPLVLHQSGIPYIWFPPYTRAEAIQLLLRSPPPLLPDPLPPYAPVTDDAKLQAIYNQFAAVVYDSLIAPTTTSLQTYTQTCARLWPRFLWPLISGENPPGRAGTTSEWDFAGLLSKNRTLFHTEGEEALQERLVPLNKGPVTFDDLISHKAETNANSSAQPSISITESALKPVRPFEEASIPPLLKYLPTVLLLSAYLASHTHPKHDIVLFSRLSTDSSTNRRKKKYLARSRAGGITKTPTKSPSKKSTTLSGDEDLDFGDETPKRKSDGAQTPKKERADRSMRAIFEKTSNIARPFTLERVIAILRAIHPDGIKMGKGIGDRVYVELGELERLRLVVRVDVGRAGKGGADTEDIMEGRWKCVVGREWVVEAGRRWGVGLEGWEVE